MHATRLILLGVFSAGCMLVPGGKTQFGGGSSKVPDSAPSSNKSSGSAKAPKMLADDDDPPHVRSALERLDKMEQMIADKKFAAYARESRDFQGTFMFQNGWADEKKHDAMKARLDALDASAFKAFGGRLEPVGDAKRVTKLDADGVDLAEELVGACQAANSLSTTGRGEASAKLASAIAAYEKQIARVKKLDPQVFRYYGEAKRSGTIDVPTKLMECEVALVGTATQFDDEYAPEVAEKYESEPSCAMVPFLADGVQIGSNKFAPYTRTVGGTQAGEDLPCNKLKKKNAYGKQFADAVKDFAGEMNMKVADLVVVTSGKPYFEKDDDDFRIHRYQLLQAYSKKFMRQKNPCGSGKTFCEAGGSKGAAAFNRAEHALDRAAVHAGKDPERCKAHLKEAKSQADWFAGFHADMVKSGDWISGATYKTKKGQKLKEKEFIAAFAAKGKEAETMIDERFCAKGAGKTRKDADEP